MEREKVFDVEMTCIYNGTAKVVAKDEDEALQIVAESLNHIGLAGFPDEVVVPLGSFSFGEATADYAVEVEDEEPDPITPQLRCKLFELYQKAADYINNANSEHTSQEIISAASDILMEGREAMEKAPDFKDVFDTLCKCYISATKDFDENSLPSLKEYIRDEYELIEQLSGYLGAYFE